MPIGKYSPIESPNSGFVRRRQALQNRFATRLKVREGLSRRIVSYQGNRDAPGLRWMKYKEGFSGELVHSLIEESNSNRVLDPFAGIGTTSLIASGMGLHGTGIEIMPVGVLAGNAIANAANGVDSKEFGEAARMLLKRIRSSSKPKEKHYFCHVEITKSAFPKETENDLAKAKDFIEQIDSEPIAVMLNLACMSVLEDISYTRKDGQYLRWDHRSGRQLRTHMEKKIIYSLSDALERKLREISEDFKPLKSNYGAGYPTLLNASCLDALRKIPPASFDTVITSPPYANRYDYTRTYALELAWIGLDQAAFVTLRQNLLSATVENKSKMPWLREIYGNSQILSQVSRMYSNQLAIQEIIETLDSKKEDLSHPNVIRLIEGYFLEMALVIAELGRIISPGGTAFIINDNVQYHGEEIPIDLILSDFAEQSGFECRNIWLLARSKGNSSQQMGRFGRREIRKCLYEWTRRT